MDQQLACSMAVSRHVSPSIMGERVGNSIREPFDLIHTGGGRHKPS
ncbi:hypothetical protein [Amycolatopsis sp. cmx-4-83]